MPSKSNVVFTSSSTGIPIPTTPTKSFDAAPSTNVPTSVQPSESFSSEQAEAEVEVEPEIEDVVETNAEDNTETVEENANETSESYTESNENEFEPEPEVVEEDLIPVEDGSSTSKAEEVLDEQTNSEDVEVEFDELNTELTVPDDVVFASSQKLHARRWDDDHRPDEVDELERKRQKFSNNEQEGVETTSNNQQEDESVTST